MSEQRIVYFDNNATSQVDEQAIAAMVDMVRETYGNPSSLHHFAERAKHAREEARQSVAALLGCRKAEIIFTSGATEAIATAFHGALNGLDAAHFVTTAVEHPAVLSNAELWRERGCRETRVGVNELGELDMEAFEAAIRDGASFAAVMVANNETGVLFPVRAVSSLCKEHGVSLLLDASQAVGKIPFDIKSLKPDYVALSGHKFNAPKGVGALYLKRGARFSPLFPGGGQERNRRSGTENMPGIVALGVAAKVARERLGAGKMAEVAELRDYLESEVTRRFPEARINGQPDFRLPNTSNLSFKHASGEAILQHLDELGIAASSSSACSSNEQEPSHVLRAMRVPESHIHGSVRIGLGPNNTRSEVDFLLEHLPRVIAAARAASPFLGTAQGDDYFEGDTRPGDRYCE